MARSNNRCFTPIKTLSIRRSRFAISSPPLHAPLLFILLLHCSSHHLTSTGTGAAAPGLRIKPEAQRLLGCIPLSVCRATVLTNGVVRMDGVRTRCRFTLTSHRPAYRLPPNPLMRPPLIRPGSSAAPTDSPRLIGVVPRSPEVRVGETTRHTNP